MLSYVSMQVLGGRWVPDSLSRDTLAQPNMALPNWLLEILRDPETLAPLHLDGDALLRPDGVAFDILDGIPSLPHPATTTGSNRKMQRFYRWLAPFYEWSERFVARHLLAMDMDQGRAEIVQLLGLKPGMRLLEVSPGPGVFQPWLRQALGREADLVAVDLSLPMLRQCRHRHAAEGAILVHANAEHLPFADASFDGVFHFGGVNLFSQPGRALAEFVRVAKPSGLVAYGDEGFASDYPEGWRRRLLTRMNPGYLRPRAEVPTGLAGPKERSVYAGLGYLLTAQKARPDSCSEPCREL